MLSGVQVDSFLSAMVVAIVLGIVNSFVKPIITFLTLPVTILTLGLFLIIINGAMVLLVDALMSSFNVNGLFWAILFSFVLAVFNFFLGSMKLDDKRSFA
ncbi:MAG: phage holin family protein [Bacteroidota bacterium]